MDYVNLGRSGLKVSRLCLGCMSYGDTSRGWHVAWVLDQGEHVHVIPGTTSIEHMEENFAAADVHIPEDVLLEAGMLINQKSVSGHRYAPAGQASIDSEEFEAA